MVDGSGLRVGGVEMRVGGEKEKSRAPTFEPLKLVETRSCEELARDGDQDGALVMVLATGELGTLHCTPVRDASNRGPIGHTAPQVRLLSAPAHEMLPFSLAELVPVTRVRRKASGEHGAAWMSGNDDRMTNASRDLVFAPLVSTMTTALDTAKAVVVTIDELDIEASPSTMLISSVRAEYGAHDRVRVWNRGALAGELVLKQGDADAVVELLAGAMCKDRIRAIDALREARDDFSRVQARLISMIESTERVAPVVDNGVEWLELARELVGELGDCAAAANVHAQYIEGRITKAEVRS